MVSHTIGFTGCSKCLGNDLLLLPLLQVEQLNTELAAERAAAHKLAGEHALADRQAHDLRGKLAELDAQLKARGKMSAAQALESRLAGKEISVESRFI